MNHHEWRRRVKVLDDVADERERQDAKWGEQNHPDGTGAGLLVVLPEGGACRICKRDNDNGTHTALEATGHLGHSFEAAVSAERIRNWATARCQNAPDDGGDTYERILTEEWAEAIAEDDPIRLRRELIQVAAVAVQWVEAIDRRQPPSLPAQGVMG